MFASFDPPFCEYHFFLSIFLCKEVITMLSFFIERKKHSDTVSIDDMHILLMLNSHLQNQANFFLLNVSSYSNIYYNVELCSMYLNLCFFVYSWFDCSLALLQVSFKQEFQVDF